MSGKQKGMGDSPLADLFTPTAPPEPPPPARAKRKQRVQLPQREQREHGEQKTTGQRQRFTVHLPEALVERLRLAVYWTPGLTLSDMAEKALASAADKLEKERGEAFPDTRGSIRGRPVRG